MSDFLNEIYAVKAEKMATKDEVVAEIVSTFRKAIFSDQCKEKLKNEIINSIKNNKNHTISVEYWNYYFTAMGYRWESPEKYKGRYKGIDIWQLRYDIANKIKSIVSERLIDLGLDYRVEDKTHSKLDYPEYMFTVVV